MTSTMVQDRRVFHGQHKHVPTPSKTPAKLGFEEIGNHDFQIGKENFEFIAMNKEL